MRGFITVTSRMILCATPTATKWRFGKNEIKIIYCVLCALFKCSISWIIVVHLQKLQITVFIIATVVTVRRALISTGPTSTSHHLFRLCRACRQLLAPTLEHIDLSVIFTHGHVAIGIARWTRFILTLGHAFCFQRVGIIIPTNITVPAKLFEIGL